MPNIELHICPRCVKMQQNFKLMIGGEAEYTFSIIKKGRNNTLYL